MKILHTADWHLGKQLQQFSRIEEQLSQYTDENKNLLRQLDKEVEGLKEVIDKKMLKEQKLIAEVSKMQLLQHIFNELVEVSESLDALISESAFYQEKQHQLDRFLKVQELFRDKILQQRQLLFEAKSKQEELSILVKENHRLEQRVARPQQQWSQAQARYADKNHMLLQSLEIQVTAIETSSSKLDTELIGICKRESFKGLKEVQKILALGLNVAQERRELEKYRTDLNALKVRKKALRKKIGRRQYQETRHYELVQEQGTLTTELHQLRHQLSGMQQMQQQ